MRRIAVLLFLMLGSAVAPTPADAAVSRTEDYLSLAERQYAVTQSSSSQIDIAAGSGNGYWLVASDGGVFAFGDAQFAGSASNLTRQAIVGMAKTKTGKGYWLVASDGGIFAFGDAQFFGSVPGLTPAVQGQHLFVGMAAAADGNGYYVYDRHGHVYAFGSAKYLGSPAGTTLDRPVTALAPTPTGDGYYMMDIRGSLWAYGDAASPANAGGNFIEYAPEPWSQNGRVQLAAKSVTDVYAMSLDGTVDKGFYNASGTVYGKATADYRLTAFALTPNGYYQVALDGSVFALGDAPFRGSLPQFVSADELVAPIIGMAITGAS